VIIVVRAVATSRDVRTEFSESYQLLRSVRSISDGRCDLRHCRAHLAPSSSRFLRVGLSAATNCQYHSSLCLW